MKALNEAEVSFKDLQYYVHKEKGIKFKTAPVSAHNYHGLVERRIRSVQDCLTRMNADKLRLHATGFQTLLKLIENEINGLPMAFSYGRNQE